MLRPLSAVAAAAFLLLPAHEAQAQLGLSFGPQLSYNAEFEEMGVGARVELSPPLLPLAAYAGADYVLVDGSMWDLTVGAKFKIGIPLMPIAPYLGGGVTHQRLSNGTDLDETGFHLLGGLGIGGLLPIGAFVEGRYLLMDEFANQFVIAAGVLF